MRLELLFDDPDHFPVSARYQRVRYYCLSYSKVAILLGAAAAISGCVGGKQSRRILNAFSIISRASSRRSCLSRIVASNVAVDSDLWHEKRRSIDVIETDYQQDVDHSAFACCITAREYFCVENDELRSVRWQ